MSLLDELGQALAAVADDPQARSAVAAEFLLRSRPPDEQAALAAAFDAAAVLRWFDAELLARVLQIPPTTAAERLRQLRALPFIEPYRSGAHELNNVHESTRLGWRSKLARETPERFRALSAAAAACFADDQTPAGRIEWIYHLLSADGESGANALETIDQEWASRAHPAQRHALATALSELEANGLLAGRARLWVLLVIGWTRVERGEAAQLAALADEALRLAVAAGDARGQGGACNLLGHVCQTRGQLDAALRAFTEALAISRRLADLDPGNADWQRDLAVAHNRVGGVLQTQGQLDAALRAFTEALAISRRLADLDPGNADWQRDLAVAHNRVGGVLEAQGQLDAALRAFTEALA
ncbi:MAG TPA: tetratricopeptide repeat protein, partial [Accumulibacter sp.]|uniref:tetratricopeptide repeat protein n=1 Tax=Accumulibacter sp. TaxID=2053492 RepID=UPI002BC60FEC